MDNIPTNEEVQESAINQGLPEKENVLLEYYIIDFQEVVQILQPVRMQVTK